MTVWYLDTSAIVKFAVVERETPALAAWRASLDHSDVLITCELAVTEVLRAVDRALGDTGVALAHLDAIEQLAVDRDLLLAAAGLRPASLRSLDAIHLAAAASVGAGLGAVVTYDAGMVDAARATNMPTLAPGG